LNRDDPAKGYDPRREGTLRGEPVEEGRRVVVTKFPVNRTFRAHPSALSQVREFVREQSALDGLEASVSDDLLLAVSEACVNAVIHTNSSHLDVSWRGMDSHIEILVHDEGVFDRKIPIPELDGTAGRGIPIMLALVDEVTIREGTPAKPGTLVRFVKHLGPPPGHEAAV
jgi:anti-sigma regulatory factor (Ser/Thr protein kinase)